MPVGNLNELDLIIRNRRLSSVFQPIFDLANSRVVGYEALIRGPADSVMHSPITLFETANQHGRISALEYVCRDVSCEQFVFLGLSGKLFLNISPMSLIQKNKENGVTNQILEKHGIPPDRVVIELSEQYPLKDYEVIRLATHHYFEMGFEIAIDDLGAGYAGLRVWSEIHPDFVKIDRHFIQNIHTDPVKREFVRSIQEISRSLGCKVIAEGVETLEELSAIRSIGIQFAQGYLLGKPDLSPSKNLPVCLQEGINSPPYRRNFATMQSAKSLIEHTVSIQPHCPLDEAADMFYNNHQLLSVPVVKKDIPIGIVLRGAILELFLGRYGRELYAKKPIHEFMNKKPIVIDESCSLEDLSQIITDDPDQDMNMDFIVAKNDRYIGTGKVKKLLKQITEKQIRSARYSNPLTLLPGNVPIYEWIDELLESKTEFQIAYCDINNFKPFNDQYGYSRGDEVIVGLGEILQQSVDEFFDLVGHIGGDDFIVIFRSQDWQERCQRILSDFGLAVEKFYNDEDLARGGIVSIDRRGDQQFFPLLSLAIGVVKPDNTRCLSHHDVSALASDAKHHAKNQEGNSIFISRRRGALKPSGRDDNFVSKGAPLSAA